MADLASVSAGLPNFRDLGGLRAAGGRRVRSGLVFRSAVLAHASAADLAARIRWSGTPLGGRQPTSPASSSAFATAIRSSRMLSITAGVGSAAASAVSFGMVYVGVGYATPFLGFFLPVLLLRGVGTVVGVAVAPAFKERIRPTKNSFSRFILVMGVLETFGFLTFNYGVSLGPGALPVVTALSGMGGAVAAAYAMTFLREKLELNQLVGVVFSLMGVFTLLYLGA